MKQFYNAILSGADGGYITVAFPDFPGCVSGGESVSEALAAGREALNFHLDGMAEDNEPIPVESSDAALAELLAEAEKHGDVCRVAVIEADVPGACPDQRLITAPRTRPDRPVCEEAQPHPLRIPGRKRHELYPQPLKKRRPPAKDGRPGKGAGLNYTLIPVRRVNSATRKADYAFFLSAVRTFELSASLTADRKGNYFRFIFRACSRSSCPLAHSRSCRVLKAVSPV